MDLVHNSTFRLLKEIEPSTSYKPGIYRVILDEPFKGMTVTVLIQEDKEEPAEDVSTPKVAPRSKGGRRKLKHSAHHRKKPPLPLVGQLIWMEKAELLRLQQEHLLKLIKIQREGQVFSMKLTERGLAHHERRLLAMAGFLDVKSLEEGIVVHGGLSGLVANAMAAANVSDSFVYKQWSSICRYGFDPRSLTPRHDRCGAKGTVRRCDPGGKKKAGRKTTAELIARAFGEPPPPGQPGMSTEWAAAIMVADKQIAVPKPRWPDRIDQIIKSQFIGRAVEVNGKLELVKPEIFTYPNDRQIKRVLTVEVEKFKRLLQSTTPQHFESSMRGLVARNWQGVGGPGHTWAIDSTVGDIYLRSSVNRAWIVGRPIVYVIVDIWSTAIVGFYVCLTGPSWNTAKVSLFNAAFDPNQLGELWGYEPVLSLAPHPTLPYCLMCDRGEYLSLGHRATAVKLIPLTSYAPPYRGDLKGLVEVIHRIEKDAQFLFIPGAMDYRRKELELRRVDPNDCVMTVREYVAYLHQLFAMYNLTADRSHRVDAHMHALGVHPSPSGLWAWGHGTGIGFQRSVDEADLISGLLSSSTGQVGRSSVRFARCDFISDEVKAGQWTALARNFGGWSLPVNTYPGSLARIWTPRVGGVGLMRLNLSEESKVSGDVTYDDYMDSLAFEALNRPDSAHNKMWRRLDFRARMEALVDRASKLTAEALAKASGATPTQTEARVMEVASTQPTQSEAATKEKAREDALSAHEELMDRILRAADERESSNAGR